MTLGGAVSLGLLKLIDSRALLVTFASGGMLTLLAALLGGKTLALIGLPLMGFWCSVGRPVVFSLALNSVEAHHGAFAGLLCTGVVVGAILPPIIGRLGDLFGLRYGVMVLLLPLGYLLSIGIWARRPSTAQAAASHRP
jgi:fucose permease